MISSTGSMAFVNTDFGGTHDWSPATGDMPDYPWSPHELIKRTSYESAGGETWEWSKYQKRSFSLNFVAVGTDAVATLGSIALEEKDFLFRVVGDTLEYEGTCIYTGDTFDPVEVVRGLWDFTYNFKEVHAR